MYKASLPEMRWIAVSLYFWSYLNHFKSELNGVKSQVCLLDQYNHPILYLVRTGFSKIEPETCKILTFLPKNTGIKMKTMHARVIYEKVGQVT